MAYTSPADVREVMTNLPKNSKDDFIKFHVEKADAYIDGLLGEVFDVPFETPPKLIKHISTDLSVYFIAEDLYSSQKPNLDEYHQKRYERAMQMLDDIASGNLGIGEDSKGQSGFGTTNKHDPIFTLEEPWW